MFPRCLALMPRLSEFMKPPSLITSFILGAALAVSAPAWAEEPATGAQSQFHLDISGQVPVTCRVLIDTTIVPSAAGRSSLGKMREFCNNPAGYRVVMDRPAIDGPATLIVDGREIPLTAMGVVIVSQSPRAAVAEHQVEIELSQAWAGGAVVFRIEPF